MFLARCSRRPTRPLTAGPALRPPRLHRVPRLRRSRALSRRPAVAVAALACRRLRLPEVEVVEALDPAAAAVATVAADRALEAIAEAILLADSRQCGNLTA